MTNSVSIAGHSPLDLLVLQPTLQSPARALSEADDIALAEAAVQHREAYAELYRLYSASVYRYMLAYVGNTHDAQDLTAQTFLAGLENIAGFRGRGKFAAWLFGIARHKVMDHFRAGRATVPLDELADTPTADYQPDEVVEDRFDYEQLAATIRTLAPDRAEAITLRIFAERSISEIAELMGRSESAVRVLLSRAVADLKRKMTNGDIDHEP